MNSFHKSKKHIALFVLIMFLCTLMPFSAFAEEPAAEPTAALADVPLTDGFKYMKINSARGVLQCLNLHDEGHAELVLCANQSGGYGDSILCHSDHPAGGFEGI